MYSARFLCAVDFTQSPGDAETRSGDRRELAARTHPGSFSQVDGGQSSVVMAVVDGWW